ncbi:hypothetical protein B0H10DRAFT_413319 [Mycena sp. CBHHK59/15]|nr:hypothetical protein B0H10DRAFT_413319 [Mycena sp. CBHHK59/15]
MGTSDLRERLAKLDAAIIQQQQVLDKLETDRRSVQLQLQSVVYPVLTLPHEITPEIFMYCLPELASTLRAPLLLLRVCRAWNSVANKWIGPPNARRYVLGRIWVGWECFPQRIVPSPSLASGGLGMRPFWPEFVHKNIGPPLKCSASVPVLDRTWRFFSLKSSAFVSDIDGIFEPFPSASGSDTQRHMPLSLSKSRKEQIHQHTAPR